MPKPVKSSFLRISLSPERKYFTEMANFSALLTIALLLCSTLMCTARPDPALSASITIIDQADPCNMQEKKIEGKMDEEENCSADDEDCLMRRSLVAHVDYIYTQKQKKH
ncbi:phytosulfokines 2 isoform X1 [Eutrema salsugineum]|uniref:phytosulfokines 2 isoform X1 n=1 Tax=Eutrema salsugineum TaxID=72664 RepID=UPI000CECF1AD|nr:phytosulfokines 2 isoform X1 [Eutrema salsugineum]